MKYKSAQRLSRDKFHFLKDPKWLQFDLDYQAQLARWSDKILVPDHENSFYESWDSIDTNHYFGHGRTFFLSKSKNAYLISFGYGWTMRLANSRYYDDSKHFYHLRYNAGIGIQLCKRKNIGKRYYTLQIVNILVINNTMFDQDYITQ